MPCIIMIFEALQRSQACTTTDNWAKDPPAQTLEQACEHEYINFTLIWLKYET